MSCFLKVFVLLNFGVLNSLHGQTNCNNIEVMSGMWNLVVLNSLHEILETNALQIFWIVD